MILVDVACRLAKTWVRFGSGAVLSLARGRLLPPKRKVLILFGLVQPQSLVEFAPGGSLEYRLATRDEVTRLPSSILPSNSLEALARGDQCVMQMVEERLVGLVWVSTASIVQLLPGVRLALPADAVYTFRTWTNPAYRGRGLQARRHLAVVRRFAPEGRRRLLCFADRANLASLNGAWKSGCRPVGRIDLRTNGDPQPRLRITAQDWSSVVLVSS